MESLEKLQRASDEFELAECLGHLLRDVNDSPEAFAAVLKRGDLGASYLDLSEWIPDVIGTHRTNPGARALREYQNCLWAGDEDCYILGAVEPVLDAFMVHIQVVSGPVKRGQLFPSARLPVVEPELGKTPERSGL